MKPTIRSSPQKSSLRVKHAFCQAFLFQFSRSRSSELKDKEHKLSSSHESNVAKTICRYRTRMRKTIEEPLKKALLFRRVELVMHVCVDMIFQSPIWCLDGFSSFSSVFLFLFSFCFSGRPWISPGGKYDDAMATQW